MAHPAVRRGSADPCWSEVLLNRAGSDRVRAQPAEREPTMATELSPTPIEIAPRTRENLSEVIRIEARSFSQPWSRQIFDRELKNKWSTGFVAYLPGVDGRRWAVG